MKVHREIMKLLDQVNRTEGWRVFYAGRHVRVYPPNKSILPLTVSTTSGDPYAINQVRRDLRKAGYKS